MLISAHTKSCSSVVEFQFFFRSTLIFATHFMLLSYVVFNRFLDLVSKLWKKGDFESKRALKNDICLSKLSKKGGNNGFFNLFFF